MVGSRRELVKREATSLGWKTLGAGAVSTAAVLGATSVGLPFLIVAGVATGGAAWTAIRAKKWLYYRGENGLRF